jgi:hypothetical protein
VLEPEDRDVAFELAGQPLGTGEVTVERRAVVALVLLLAAQLVREQRVAPGSVDDEARAPVDPRAVVVDLDRRTVAVERDRADALALERARALGGGVAKEQLVELGAAHLPRVGHRLVPRLDELDELAVVVVGRDELDAVLGHADRLDLLAHAEALEQRGVGRQQRLADVKARVVRLLDDDDVAAGRGEQRGDRRARRPAADDEDVAATLLAACGRIGTGRQGLHGAGSPVSFVWPRPRRCEAAFAPMTTGF